MYSYEDRIRAVALFIKLAIRVRPPSSSWGTPTKNSLKGWYRKYQQRQDLPKCGLYGHRPDYKRRGCPPCQNTCRLHRFRMGAQMREQFGSILTRIQRPSGSAHAATGERATGSGVA